ncbi:MAG TPA: hypothetical protein VEY92_13935 [Pseudoxanthomonas sp.]|nr:hypothetical protein [Pseudoxanthomonas sp.]
MKIFRSPQLLALTIVATLAVSACNRNDSSDDAAAPTAAPDVTATSPTTDPATGPPLEPVPEPAAGTVTGSGTGTAPAASGTMASQFTVRSISVGNAASADRSVIARPGVSRIDPIIVSVRTDGSASNVNIGARLTYQDGQVAGEESQVLNTSGSEITNIEFRDANGWPEGRYTVDVTVNGQPAGAGQQIEVR